MGNHAGDARNNNRGWSWLARTSMLIVMLSQLLVFSSIASADNDRTIWHSREEFVDIVAQDDGSSTPPNDHPASVTGDEVRNALSSMVLAPNDDHKQLPVFNEPEIDMLSQYIPEALSQAGPREDVTFAIVGHFSAFVDFLKVRQVTTGRVFYKDGKLNIIFGIIHRDLKENEDRRLHPLTPGSRTQPADLKDRIMAAAGDGQPFEKPRGDWVVFSQKSMDTPPVAAAPANTERFHGDREQRAAGSRHQAAEPKTEAPRSAEERLMQLNELKNKHLITDEEYRTKRMEILNAL